MAVGQSYIGEFESIDLVEPEPSDLVVLLGREVGDFFGPLGHHSCVESEIRSIGMTMAQKHPIRAHQHRRRNEIVAFHRPSLAWSPRQVDRRGFD